jgi:hypothetical protein
MPDRTIVTTFLQKVLLILCSTFLVVLVVCAGELYCRWFTRVNFGGISRGLFVGQMFGDSYGNRPDYHGIAFGADVQTDLNGFRIDSTFSGPTSDGAVLILGDSVAFGVGVDSAKTVAALLQRSMPRVRFYNSSVIGYGLHDYAYVVKQFVPMHPEITQVLLFYCLNDIYETNAEQILQQVNEPGKGPGMFSSLPVLLSTTNEYLRSRSKLYLYVKAMISDPALRYFQADYAEYLRRIDHIDESLQPLVVIAKELATRGVSLNVFMMPYNAQVRTKNDKDFLPQQLVGEFLRKNGIAYCDAAQAFMKADMAPEELYLFGDPMHLSEDGHGLLAKIVAREMAQTDLERRPAVGQE